MTPCSGTCVNLQTSATNCGSCGHDCTVLPNVNGGSVQCGSGGTCLLPAGACKAGFANCTPNGAETDGCETPTNTLTNCGRCGNACTVANGTAKCNTDGTCGVASCTGNYHLCPGANTCYANTDATHCGSSCTPCSAPAGATATCQNNTCGFQCNSGFACGGSCYGDNVEVTCGASTTCAAWTFESGLQGWAAAPDFESSVSVNTATAPAGRPGKALIMTFPSQPTKVLALQVNLCAQAANILGRSIKASVYIDATTVPGSFAAYSLLNGVEQGDSASVPARTWTTVTLGFAGSEGATRQVGITFDPGTAAEGKVYLDDVQIVP